MSALDDPRDARSLAHDLAAARTRRSTDVDPAWSIVDVEVLLDVAGRVEPGLAAWVEEVALRIMDHLAKTSGLEQFRRLLGGSAHVGGPVVADDIGSAKPMPEAESQDTPPASLQRAIEAGLDDVRRGRTTDGRDAIAQVRARRAYCPGCQGPPLRPVQIGDTVRCALHPDALGDASLDS